MKVADLTELIIDELSRPAEINATSLVKSARDRVIGVKAALFYGSCLRDGITTNSIADLYLLIEDDASKKRKLADSDSKSCASTECHLPGV